jgi:hypothetical protein
MRRPALSKMSIGCDLEVPLDTARNAARSAEGQMQPDSTIQTGDALSHFNPVSREVLFACRLSHRSSRRLIPAGIRIAGEMLAHF